MTETVVVFFRAVITIWNNQPLLKAWKLSVNILGSLLPLLVVENLKTVSGFKRSEMKIRLYYFLKKNTFPLQGVLCCVK